VVSKLLVAFGTAEQRDRYLPRMATGELRATMALTEPGGGSDLQAMTTTAKPVEGGYVVNGAKTWITNSRHSGLIALLCKTDPAAEPKHRGVSILLVEHGRGSRCRRTCPSSATRASSRASSSSTTTAPPPTRCWARPRARASPR
jgi:alkylation response protein AidB-like acyl-CoA dehydrogenase